MAYPLVAGACVPDGVMRALESRIASVIKAMARLPARLLGDAVYAALGQRTLREVVESRRLILFLQVMNRPRRRPGTGDVDLVRTVLDLCSADLARRYRTDALWDHAGEWGGRYTWWSPLGKPWEANRRWRGGFRGLLHTLHRSVPRGFNFSLGAPDFPFSPASWTELDARAALFNNSRAQDSEGRTFFAVPAVYRPGSYVRLHADPGGLFWLRDVDHTQGLLTLAPLDESPDPGDRLTGAGAGSFVSHTNRPLRWVPWPEGKVVKFLGRYDASTLLRDEPHAAAPAFAADAPPGHPTAREVVDLPLEPAAAVPRPPARHVVATVLSSAEEGGRGVCAVVLEHASPGLAALPGSFFCRFRHDLHYFFALAVLLLLLPTVVNVRVRTDEYLSLRFGWRRTLPRREVQAGWFLVRSRVLALLEARRGLTTFVAPLSGDSPAARDARALLEVARGSTRLLLAPHVPAALRCTTRHADELAGTLEAIRSRCTSTVCERWRASPSQGEAVRALVAARGTAGLSLWLEFVRTRPPHIQAFLLRFSTRTAGVNVLRHEYWGHPADCALCPGVPESAEHVFSCPRRRESLSQEQRAHLRTYNPPLPYLVGGLFPTANPDSILPLCETLHHMWVLRCSHTRRVERRD